MSDSTRTLRVQQKSWEAAGVTAITLVDPTGADQPGWEPGAHLALHLPNRMVRGLEQRERPWRLLYTGRSRSTMAFLDEIAQLPADRVTVHADDEFDIVIATTGQLVRVGPPPRCSTR
ncbi:hypothetical protein [Nocardia jiangxiensis]